MGVVKSSFGKTKDGQEVSAYRLTNAKGAYAQVLDYGAVLQAVVVKDKDDKDTDVVLGYDTVEGYEKGGCFFGATIGRSGNRIEGAGFTIEGQEYRLTANENENNLHSGPEGYESRMWQVREICEEENSITFGLLSPDGDQGYPGELNIMVKYQMSENNEVIIHYMGVCDRDTVVNMTNHSYFNLEGHDSGSVNDIRLKIQGGGYTPVADSKSIPTGEVAPVKGTPMDFTKFKEIGRDMDAKFDQLQYTGGYDHNYAADDYEPGMIRVIANAHSSKTGITMEVSSDLPGVQFYAGNFVKDEHGKEGVIYGEHSGFCLETQYFPNSVNQESFVSPVLEAGQPYNTITIYRFDVE